MSSRVVVFARYVVGGGLLAAGLAVTVVLGGPAAIILLLGAAILPGNLLALGPGVVLDPPFEVERLPRPDSHAHADAARSSPATHTDKPCGQRGANQA